MAKQKIVEAVATKPHSQGTGQHVEAGQWFHGEKSVVDRLVGMGKARYPTKGETPVVGEPETTSRRATRGR